MLAGHGRLFHIVFSTKYQIRRLSHNARMRDTSNLRNMAIVAHIDSGKTTLTESILLKSAYLSAPGSVDSGSTTTDFLPAERERGITIQSASIPVYWKNWTFNLIDTPGHADFGMEVESASRVVDGAVVVIDSAQGVEPQTKGVWRQLDRYNVKSRIIFMNKLDRPGAALRASLLSVLSNRLHPQPLLLSIPVASLEPANYDRADPGIVGVIDLVKWEFLSSKEGTTTRQKLPSNLEELETGSIFPPGHPLPRHLISARASLLESISMLSEPFMEVLLGLPDAESFMLIKPMDIISTLRELTLRGQALPILCGSAIQHIGTELLMDYVGELLPNPLDVALSTPVRVSDVQALAWKVAWDKRRGWLTFVRVYSGTIHPRHSIINTSRNERERPSKLILLFADQEVEVESLPVGSVGVILGLKHTRAGDTLCGTAQAKSSVLPEISPPTAVITASLIPQSYSDEEPLLAAVRDLNRTDPSVRFENDQGQMLIHALGPLHLEIVESRLREEWGVRFELGARRVNYRETLTEGNLVNTQEAWSTNIQGASVEVIVHATIRLLGEVTEERGSEAWGGSFVVFDGKSLPPPAGLVTLGSAQFGNFVAQGVFNALSNGPHSSLPLTSLHVSVEKVDAPPNAPPSCITGAVATVLTNVFKAQGLGRIMEPYVEIHLELQDQHVGPVIADIGLRGGEILDLESGSDASQANTDPYVQDGLYIPPDWLSPCSSSSNASRSAIAVSRRSISARGPLARFLDFSQRLKAITGGHGLFTSTNIGHRVVNSARAHEILQEMGRT